MIKRYLTIAWTCAILACLLIGGPAWAVQDGSKKAPAKPAAKPAAAKPAPPSKASTPKPAPTKTAPAKKEAKAATPPATKSAGAKSKPAQVDPAKALAEFDQQMAQWKELLKQLRSLRHDFQTADAAQSKVIQQKWDAVQSQILAMIPAIREAAVQAFLAKPNADRELTRFLIKLLQDTAQHDQYAAACRLGDVLIEHDDQTSDVLGATATSYFALHQFGRTKELLEQAKKNNMLPPQLEPMIGQVEQYKEYWTKEQETRKKEAEADDLPRVKLTTNKGDIVLELFENEAPETVANFISLVQSGYYDGLTFHRVLPGFMAQAGCPVGDGSGGPGYTIYDECRKPNARMHFRGSLSMAKTQAPDSGGSQFFITFRPTANLNGKHTVFGRVLSGMDVVDKIQRRNPDAKEGDLPEPDIIIKAEVLRKRDHEYLPHKVE